MQSPGIFENEELNFADEVPCVTGVPVRTGPQGEKRRVAVIIVALDF